MTKAKSRVGICFLDRPDVDRQISGAKLAESQEDSRFLRKLARSL